MAKILLVEDDNNLREIYEARLQAEGYEIVAARDGEEALTVAMKERPDLIISDVMMPKISGFDMLDIIRSTEETKDTKVIMMTALSQAEDKERANKLGADRYLVKSQVTLEDVAKVAREVLSGESKPATEAATEGALSAGCHAWLGKQRAAQTAWRRPVQQGQRQPFHRGATQRRTRIRHRPAAESPEHAARHSRPGAGHRRRHHDSAQRGYRDRSR